MKWLWYQLVKCYIRLGLFFYYRSIACVGTDHIPKKGAVLFVCNHQNALIDPLLIATNTKRNMFFLTRAGVFKTRFLKSLFHSLQMLPIYRIRDGWSTLAKNELIFKQCYEVLKNEKALLIFPEGSHNQIRKVRPLSKGFTRILFGAKKKYPDLEINIVPVGLNFSSVVNYPSSVSIHFGKSISFNPYFNIKDERESVKTLLNKVHASLSKLTTHIEGTNEAYTQKIRQLRRMNVDYLNPIETNKLLKRNLEAQEVSIPYKNSVLYYILIIINLAPWLIWKKAKASIKEPEFVTTFRFAFLISLFPLVLILKFIVLSSLFDWTVGLIFLTSTLTLSLIYIKTASIRKD